MKIVYKESPQGVKIPYVEWEAPASDDQLEAYRASLPNAKKGSKRGPG